MPPPAEDRGKGTGGPIGGAWPRVPISVGAIGSRDPCIRGTCGNVGNDGAADVTTRAAEGAAVAVATFDAYVITAGGFARARDVAVFLWFTTAAFATSVGRPLIAVGGAGAGARAGPGAGAGADVFAVPRIMRGAAADVPANGATPIPGVPAVAVDIPIDSIFVCSTLKYSCAKASRALIRFAGFTSKRRYNV
jgi:hypothetical protein